MYKSAETSPRINRPKLTLAKPVILPVIVTTFFSRMQGPDALDDYKNRRPSDRLSQCMSLDPPR
jgi:hypothetical protein